MSGAALSGWLRIISSVASAALIACGPSTSADPVFESTSVVEVVAVRGGDCAEQRCVQVIAPVVGSRRGEGFCHLYASGDPDGLEPLAESPPLEMEPDEDTVWEVELPDHAPRLRDLNPACEPMMEG